MTYGSAANFETYHTVRGKSIPAEWHTTEINAALLVASEWVDNLYSKSFTGYKTDGYSQVREWPRTQAISDTFPQYVFSTTEIPDEMADAAYEAAFRELTKAGALNVDFTPNKYNKASVDGAVAVEYTQNLLINDVQVQIGIIESILRPLLDPNKGGASSGLSGDVNRR